MSSWLPFLKGIRGFVARRVPVSEVDDVVQDVMLRLHESSSDLRQLDRIEAWVYTVTRRTIADFFRRRAPAGEELAADLADATAEPENLSSYQGDHDVHEEVLSWMRSMAEDLPEEYRLPLVMAEFDGLTQQQVADRLGLSLSGAKSRVQRARARLGDAVRECCAVEFGPDARAAAFRRLCEEC